MTKRILLDAGPWFAALSKRDRHHAWAVAQFQRFTGFVTCEPVVTEVCHRLAFYKQPQALALDAIDCGAVMVDFRLSESMAMVRGFLSRYSDQGIDLADACLATMAEEEPRTVVVTTDQLFERIRLSDRTALPVSLPPVT